MDRTSHNNLAHSLGERVKELTALHQTARLLKDVNKPIPILLQSFVELLPSAWQFPEITVAQIRFEGIVAATPNFRLTKWTQTANFRLLNDECGTIQVCYLEERPGLAEGPFLAEERELIESLAEILQNYLQYRDAMSEVQRAHDGLDQLVQARTLELRNSNSALELKIAEYQNAQHEIEIYQKQLRKMTVDLSLAEARERREIAGDLHDHIGQALAIIRMRLAGFQSEAVFSGLEGGISDIISLLDQTIQYTRTLTFAISPPVLYELGLSASLEWLGEQFTSKHGLPVRVDAQSSNIKIPEELQVFVFKTVQELLTNALKHSEAGRVDVSLTVPDGSLEITVRDDGKGFDPKSRMGSDSQSGFGLFSIRERLLYLGGSLTVQSAPGKGTSMIIRVPVNL